MRLKADRVEVKKVTNVANNADSMREEIETKAELIVIYTGANLLCFLAQISLESFGSRHHWEIYNTFFQMRI